MALTESIVLKDEAAANHTFVTTSVEKNATSRLDQATSLALPTKLVVSHSTSGSGADIVDRHLIQAARTELDANDLPFTTIVNLTIAMPRKSASNATVYDLVSFLKDLVDTAGVKSDALDDILQGQS